MLNEWYQDEDILEKMDFKLQYLNKKHNNLQMLYDNLNKKVNK